ncbi:MAG TPA: serine hydrolase domain-containing protein [Chitinophagaceae bacterium]|nr:serine hydrolase domain-containing protein [Chitinophagaceae bacterium]
MRIQFIFIICLAIFMACNSSSDKKNPVEDSLQYYPPTPQSMSKEEFRMYYRKLSDFFDTSLLQSGFNGGILIAKNGNVIYEKYKGRIDLRKPDTITANTPFHIASTSKTFTAIAILRLVQEGKLSLNDSITKFFPELPYPGITVKMLLNHRSGLPNYLYFMSNNKWGILPDGKWNRQMATNYDMLKMLCEKKPDPTGRPDGRFNYSNTNYALLALIVEKASGQSFPDFMKEKIFKPLQMNNSFVFTLRDSLTATPSFTAGGTYWNNDFLDATYGDKNIYSTPGDMLKWDQALYTNQLLSQPLLDSAFKPYSFEKPGIHNYGLGWRLQLLPNGKKVIYHFGKWHGNNAAFARLTDEKATIIILGNRFNRNIYNTAHLCYDIFGDYLQRRQTDDDESPEAPDKTPAEPAGKVKKQDIKKASSKKRQ